MCILPAASIVRRFLAAAEAGCCQQLLLLQDVAPHAQHLGPAATHLRANPVDGGACDVVYGGFALHDASGA